MGQSGYGNHRWKECRLPVCEFDGDVVCSHVFLSLSLSMIKRGQTANKGGPQMTLQFKASSAKNRSCKHLKNIIDSYK